MSTQIKVRTPGGGVGAWLVARATSWSTVEKAVGVIAPVASLLVVVGAVALWSEAQVGPFPLLLALPLTTSVSSAVGAVYLMLRLVVHKRAAEIRR